MDDSRIAGLSALVESLLEPVDAVIQNAMPVEMRQDIIDTGIVRPAANEFISAWFARVVSLRSELLDVIHRVDVIASIPLREITTKVHWQCFVIGYSAACLLVRLDRFFLFEFATHKTIQRKLNEGFSEYRVPTKQYTAIFVHFTDPVMALRLNEVMKFANLNRAELTRMESDRYIGELARRLTEFESYLDASKRNYLKRTGAYLLHSWRRRGARAKQQSMFAVLEGLGRTASELNLKNEKQVTPEVIDEALSILEPGDVLLTRHRYALTNFFLPGVWPHAALYVGTPKQRDEWCINVPEEIRREWSGDISTFEALKDGVKLRPLSETLAVDYFIVLRPVLSKSAIRQGIERVLVHKGKRYNFDFDFFRSDRLVCTEVIYRAFDGLDDFHIPLQERAGRQTISAEDFLDLAFDTAQFSIEGIFGYPYANLTIIRGEQAITEAKKSYQSD